MPLAAALPEAARADVYAYDAPAHSAPTTEDVSQRGPPATYDHALAHNVGGSGSRDALARSGDATAPATCTYDDAPQFARTARGSWGAKGSSGGGQAPRDLTQRLQVAAKTGHEFVNLASDARTTHILDGEVRLNGSFGGGHRPGTGFPNKSEFPLGWSDGRIMHEISDVATDPSLAWRNGNRAGDFFVNGSRGGVDIEVLIRNDQIWTGYPTNLPRNPR